MNGAETADPSLRHPDRPAGRRLAVAAVAALVCLGLPACGDDEEPLKVVDITATLAPLMTGNADPAVFFEERPSARPHDVTLAVMLRTTTSYDIDSINLHIKFDQGVLQVAGLTWNMTPLGECGGPAACAPQCLEDSGFANANGDLFLGVSENNLDTVCTLDSTSRGQRCQTVGNCPADAQCFLPMCQPGDNSMTCCDPGVDCVACGMPDPQCVPCGVYLGSESLSGQREILTIVFRAATVGSSRIELVTGASGDCEVLSYDTSGPGGDVTVHPFTFDDGGALVTATR